MLLTFVTLGAKFVIVAAIAATRVLGQTADDSLAQFLEATPTCALQCFNPSTPGNLTVSMETEKNICDWLSSIDAGNQTETSACLSNCTVDDQQQLNEAVSSNPTVFEQCLFLNTASKIDNAVRIINAAPQCLADCAFAAANLSYAQVTASTFSTWCLAIISAEQRDANATAATMQTCLTTTCAPADWSAIFALVQSPDFETTIGDACFEAYYRTVVANTSELATTTAPALSEIFVTVPCTTNAPLAMPRDLFLSLAVENTPVLATIVLAAAAILAIL
ncbi:hypothetical protein HDU82_007433 [Entophlyctis luteolus]|nr:hypothetical protein HDU82_007433 [Entophlyctis luteolus]